MKEPIALSGGFFTIASNTPGREASQLQTNRNYGTDGAASLERRNANRAHLEIWQLTVTATIRVCANYAFTAHGS